jgi:protein-L-isoaspartate(D-aspartate) O-methyltransferase
MSHEDERLTLEGESDETREERIEHSQERRSAREVRRHRDRQFMGVLLIFAVVFFAIGVVLARMFWRPKTSAAGESAAAKMASTETPAPAKDDPPAVPTDPTVATPAVSEQPAHDISTREPIPFGSKEAFAQHLKAWRHEDDKWLDARWERYQACVNGRDLTQDRVKQAFLATPRQLFCRERNLPLAYASKYLDIGRGVTISGPHIVARMTNALDPQPDQKCLEIGTGSGYQAAFLANLSNHVYSIEIITPLAEETKGICQKLIAEGYDEYKNVHLKAADGYYGWEEYAPFDRIIVTCGIDHIPPDLGKQLAPGGIMVIPIGNPGSQRVMKVTKKPRADGGFDYPKEDLYPELTSTAGTTFVPFTRGQDGKGGNHFGEG